MGEMGDGILGKWGAGLLREYDIHWNVWVEGFLECRIHGWWGDPPWNVCGYWVLLRIDPTGFMRAVRTLCEDLCFCGLFRGAATKKGSPSCLRRSLMLFIVRLTRSVPSMRWRCCTSWGTKASSNCTWCCDRTARICLSSSSSWKRTCLGGVVGMSTL